jgi:hypothetical protein
MIRSLRNAAADLADVIDAPNADNCGLVPALGEGEIENQDDPRRRWSKELRDCVSEIVATAERLGFM